MRNAFIGAVEKLAQDDPEIHVVSGDAGFGVFDRFASESPERFVNAGVAEANAIGYAAGMTLAGFNVFVYNIAPFVLYRCFEQVRNDICYQRLPVTLIGIGAGLTYAPGGMTHYSVEDLAICRALPNLVVISPIDPVETRAAVEYAAGSSDPVYLRIGRAGEPELRHDGCPDVLEPAVVREGEGVALLSHGGAFSEALGAWEMLASEGKPPRLLSVPTIHPFPDRGLSHLLEGCHSLVTVEEHYVRGGLGSRVAEWIVERGAPVKLSRLGLPQEFVHAVDDQAGLRRRYGIDATTVADAIRAVH